MAMIHPKKLAQLVRKWQRVKTASREDEVCCTTSPVADKGHCAMYTADGRRFEVPLAYLGTAVFGELLRMSQEEAGFTCDSRITLPFDAAVMEYVMCLVRRNASEEVERAFLSSVVMPCQYSSCTVPHVVLHQQLAVCSSSLLRLMQSLNCSYITLGHRVEESYLLQPQASEYKCSSQQLMPVKHDFWQNLRDPCFASLQLVLEPQESTEKALRN